MRKNLLNICIGIYITLMLIVSANAGGPVAVSPAASSAVAMPISSAKDISAPAPAPQLNPASEITAPDFLSQVLQTIKNIGGVKTMIAISMILTLLVSSMKVSFLNQLIWSKLGEAKVFVAPILALIAGVLGLGAGGEPVTAALVLAYVSAGGGAVFLHEILDALKSIPGIGPMYISFIDFLKGFLKGPAPKV